tara:strand:+ start:27 stop:416 length:390 start_codon:yes stop_codon:yes gene_type:complete
MAAIYKTIISKEILLFIDAQAIMIPQLKVSPKKSCGQYVNLFMNGYENARSIELIPRIIVKKLNCINIKKARAHRKITYSIDCLTEIIPDAIGLLFVLLTFLSKSLSTISFTIHPALLIKTEPKKNSSK